MSTKMIFIFRLFFVIIVLANFTFCIQNGGTIPDTEERNHNMIKFSEADAILALPETTNEHRKTFESQQRNTVTAEQNKFTFHTNQHQNAVDSPTQPTPGHERGKYSQYSTASRQGGNPLNSVYNSGEHYQSSGNYHQRYPSSNFNRPYGGQHPSSVYDTGNIAANYQPYHDKPNYYQDNYAHNYNYPGNKRPTYNHRATPPPQPYDYPYQHQYYQNARPRPPYPYPHPYPNIGQQQSPNDYTSYAGLFNNFQGFPNPLTSLFGMFGGSGKPSNPLGSQISKALEDVAANDDLNCVPKLLCQMAGNPERRAELPSFLTAPAITSLIAALPATSPVLVFGRAALLGFTGGEESCASTYDKCPGNEDDLLYYLNNHRGGFFRFFNGGGSFNEVSSNFDDSSPQYTGTRPQSSNFGDNQGSASSSGGGLNLLGTLASFFMPSLQSANSGSDGLVSMVGNLLGGLVVPQRTKSRKRTRRSLDTVETLNDADSSNTTVNAKDSVDESETKLEKTEDENNDKIEGRILNNKAGILSDSNNYEPPVKFPFDDQSNYADNYRYGKEFSFRDYKTQNLATYVKYPNNDDDDDDDDGRPYRGGKQISFKNDDHPSSSSYYSQQEDKRYDDQNDRPYHTKMIFPDRTGTGNLRFDSTELESDSDRNRDYNRYPDRNRDQNYNRYRDDRDRDSDRGEDYNRDRYRNDDRDYNRDRYTHRDGKILTKPSYSKYDKYYDYDELYNNNKRKPYYSSNAHNNDYHNSNRYDYTTTRRPYYSRYETTTTRRPYYSRYETTTTRRPYYSRYETTRRPSYNDNDYGNRYSNTYSSSSRPSGGEGNTYITNANGVVEYYIKPNGQKVYI